jgi:23S rRNA (cytidine1920-2'-O)/16S rRNA (cytidine1409-2'-O)-methyltransferase
MNQKKRFDVSVFERGLAPSREKAQALIMAGIVYLNGNKQTKAGLQVKDNDIIEIKGSPNPYVSRGGLKLQKAVEHFGIDLNGLICLDIGASTGGFTDCMLSFGAAKVFAVDVGYSQLAWKLRTDERVINLERTNFRYVTAEQITDKIDFASVDVSFISLRLILPALYPLMKDGGQCVCLIKPQFEAGKERIGKKGVVRDPDVHIEVVKMICDFALDTGFGILNIDYSPIKGPEGNIEYLMHINKTDTPVSICSTSVEELVKSSHEQLDGGDNS